MPDVALTVAVCVVQGVLGYMGVHVSLKPPGEARHSRWIVAFVIIGLSSMVLTGWLAKRAGDAQHSLEAQLTRIEHNPPKVEVNVPTAAPPQVFVTPPTSQAQPELSRGFMQLAGVKFTKPSLLQPGSFITANVYLVNKGSEPVEDFQRQIFATLRTVDEKPEQTDREVRKFVEKYVKDHMVDWKGRHVSVGVGDQPWNTLQIGGELMTESTIEQIKNGKVRYYISIWSRWKGAKHDLNVCQWLQPPADKPDWSQLTNEELVWHVCAG